MRVTPNCGVRIRLLGQHLTFVHKNLPVFRRESMSILLRRKKPETIINYQKMLDLTNKFGELIWDSYEKVQVNGRTFWREKR